MNQAAYSIRVASALERLARRPGLEPWVRRPLEGAHFLASVYAQFERDRCYQMASALTFSALLAVVPVTAVTFSLFAAFGTFAELRKGMQTFLLRQLVPTSDLAQNLDVYLNQFTANTYQVTFVSVISLFVTAVMLFMTIEYSLAHIWPERRSRSVMRNITIFTSILVWGPLLLGLSTYLSLSMDSRTHTYVDPIVGSRLWSYVFPYATSVLMFVLGFTVLPSAQVEIRAALLGASLSAFMWEFAKYGFGVYIGRAVFYSNVYGSLSTVPVFLLWIYTSWLIFLYGAEVSYCYQYRRWMRMRGGAGRPSHNLQLLTALASLIAIGRRFREGREPPRVDEIAQDLRLPSDIVGRALQPLRDAGLLIAARGQEMYLLARNPDSISVLEVFRAIHPAAELDNMGQTPPPELENAAKVLRVLQDAQARALEDVSVAQMLDTANGSPLARS